VTKRKNKPERLSIAVGDHVKVNLHHGKLEDGVVKAIVQHTDGVRFQIDLGGDKTALVHEWQIRSAGDPHLLRIIYE
jgi:hypothetical protein